MILSEEDKSKLLPPTSVLVRGADYMTAMTVLMSVAKGKCCVFRDPKKDPATVGGNAYIELAVGDGSVLSDDLRGVWYIQNCEPRKADPNLPSKFDVTLDFQKNKLIGIRR